MKQYSEPARYLPEYLKSADIRTCIGLISDTHMPQRNLALPTSLPEIFSGIDFMILDVTQLTKER